MPSNYSAPPTLADDIGNLTVSNFAGSAIQISSEAFTDSNTVLMTAASTDDRIDAKGFLTTSTANSTYAPINNPTFTGTITTPSHANVDTVLTSVSSKAPTNAPTFTGTVAIPGFSDVATTLGGIATNAAAITALTNGAPDLLNTLDELAAAIDDDANFATTITNALAGKADAASPTLTGTPNLSQGFAIGGTDVTATAAEINILDGATVTTAEINLLDGVTASTSELNITDGITVSTADINRVGGTTATTAELNLLSGVTALTSLPGLSSSVTELNTLDGLTADTSELNILDGATLTTTELNKLDGFTGEAADLNFAKELRATGVTSTELDILDGGTAATSTTVVAGDRVVYNDDGTMKQVAMSDIVTFLNDSSVLTLLGATSPGNAISGLTSTAAELNILDGATLSTTELNYVDGVTSAIQTQLNAKAALGGATFTGAVNIPADSLQLAGTAITSTAGELNILDGVTATSSEINKLAGLTASTNELNLLDGVTATTAEINYLDGVTSNIQTQLDGSVSTLNPTFTGTVSIPTPFNIGGVSMTATAAELNIMDGVTASTGEINVLDGLTATTSELNAVAGLTATTSELNILDGATLSTNELNLLDGLLASTAELSIMDGATSATSTVVAAADRLVYNDDGTMKQVAISDLVTFLNDASVLTNVGGGSNAVSAASNFGTDNVLIKSDGTSKGSQATGITIADSTNNMSGVGTISSGAITSSGVVTATGITIGSAAILEAELEILDGATVTTAELNLLDGVTATTSEINILSGLTANKDELNLLDASGGSTTTLATGDAFIIGDADASNATKKVLLSDLIALINAQTLTASTTGNAATATAATTAAALTTARTIAGVSFDGSANIAIAPTDLTGVTATASEINILDGATLDVNELNLLDGVTATTSEINKLDGLTSSTAELNLLDASAGSSVAVASGDAIIIGDASDSNATKKTTVANLVTFLNDASVLTNVGSSIATALVSLSGVSSGSTDLGTFTGSTIADNQTIKQALQANETAIELRAPIANPTFTGEIGIGSVNVDETELGILEGATVTTAELNKLDGVTATTAQLNIVSGKTLLTSSDSFSNSDSNLLTAAATFDIITEGSVLSALKFSNSANNLISSTAVTGTDTAGKNLTLAGGQGTGTGAGGSIVLQVAPAGGSSGSSANSLATAVTISSDKAVALEGALTVAGNLTVNGTTTTVSTTNTVIADKLITLNDGGGSGSGTATGLEIEENGSATGFFKTDGTGDWTLKGAGTAANAVLTLDVNATKTITVGGALSIEADSVINQDLSTDASPQFTAVTADLTGDVTGNADTATTLATARNIGGVSFDGSANINLPGVNTAGSQDTSGNAATATALATARTIAGQSFDGSANISIAPTDLTSVTSTATEINILDAGTSGSSVTLADGDSLIIGDASASNETKKVLMSDVQTYISASGGGISNVVEDTTPQLGGDLDTNGNTIQLKNGATSAGFIEFYEDTDNGTNKVTLIGPASTADVTITLPSTAGTVALTSSDITGNAATATALATARNIGGVSFDGTANINLPGVNTAGNQNTTGSAATLTTARNIGGVSFDGSANIDLPGVNTAGSQDTSGNAATATALATARTIGGVSFDGSANINLPGVNSTGNQDTSGNAATATKIASITNSNIVQLAESQTLINKTLTTPTLSTPVLADSTDGTKKATFDISGISTSTTRTITLPDHDISAAALTFLKDLQAAGVTVTELDTLDGITADTSELNILDGATLTTTELNYVDGVTSAIQTQLDAKQASVSGAASTITGSNLTASRALVSNGSGKVAVSAVTSTELGYLDGVTSAIQTQLNAKAALAGATFTGAVTGTDLTLSGNLTVNGTTTTLATTNSVISDRLIELGNGTTGTPGNDMGLVFERGDSDNAFIGWDESADKFTMGTGSFTGASTGNLTITAGTLVANLEGDVTGNADTATTLANARTIAGQSFDGSANITIAPTDLTSVTADATEINILDGATLTTTELNYVDGVTSAIQTQLNAKQATITGAATTIDDTNLTASRALVSNGSGKVAVSAVTSDELSMLDGGTSASSVTLADADRLIVNDDGTMKQVAMTAISTYVNAASGGISNVVEDTTPQLGGDLDTNGNTIQLKNGATSAGFIEFYEDTDNGTNKVTLIGPASTADVTITLPSTAGTVALTSSDITGNAATATALATARNIGGVSFDGTANINLPGVNTSGSQDTSGNAATATKIASITNSNIVQLADTQTLTNKRLTSPKLNEDVAISATATEVNILDGATLTTTELNYVDGVTSAIQTQLNAKQATITGAATTIDDTDLTASRAVVSNSSGKVAVSAVTSTELGYLDGVTSAIQTQLNAKAALAGATFTGAVTGTDLTLSGNLTVNGTTTTLATTNSVISDRLIELGNGTTGTPANDMGLVFERGDSANAFIGWDESADKFTMGTGTFTGASTGNLTITAGTLVANLEGDVTGNADTATALETARNIGGVSFDGTANINLPGVNTSGSQDTSGNAATATALATARNIGGVSFDGSANINLPGVNTAGSQDTSGNAATATALATARNIGGVSFDGTANINLPGVNTAGNQNTSGTAAGLSSTLAVGSGGTGVTTMTALKDALDDETWTFANKITADAGIDIDNFNIDGTTISLSSGDMTLDAEGDIILDAKGDDIILKEDGTTFGRFKRASGDFVIKSETSNKHILFKGNDGGTTITALDLDMENGGAASFNAGVTATGFTIGSAAIGEAELEILDGATVTTAELNIMDGNTSATATTLVDADRLVVNDNGTMVQVAFSDVATYIGSASGTFTATDITSQTDLGNNANGADSFVIHDASASALREMTISNLTTFLNSTSVLSTFAPTASPTFTGTLTAATLDISGNVDIDGSLETDGLSINGTTVNSTAGELNQLDAGESIVNFTIAEADGIIISDTSASATKKAQLTDLEAYMQTYLSVLNGGGFMPGIAGTPGDKEIPTYDNSNNGFGTSSKLSFNGTHGQSNGLTVTNANISAGSDIEAASRTNNTNKQVTLSSPHYHNAEEDVQGLHIYNSDGTNSVCIGGGNSNFNAATEVKISAAANDATVTGTEQVVITSSDTVVKNVFQGYKTSIKAVSSNTTLTDADSGKTIYWTGGTLTLPATAEVGQQFVVINNTNGSATPGLGTSNAIATNWTAHAAMADETARTYICPVANKWIYIG